MMDHYPNTEEGNCAYVRDLLFKNEREFWGRLQNVITAMEGWKPLDPRKPSIMAPIVIPNLEDDEADEQEWMNEVRAARYNRLGI